jgi:hypothetical protein
VQKNKPIIKNGNRFLRDLSLTDSIGDVPNSLVTQISAAFKPKPTTESNIAHQ